MEKTFQDLLNEKLTDPVFKAEYEELSIAAQLAEQIICLRQEKGLTQSELAKQLGTKQSSISRLENMDTVPSLSFLMKVASILDAKIDIRLLSKDSTCL